MLLILLLGIQLTSSHIAYPALRWMEIYFPADFLKMDYSEIKDFIYGLKIPIPPIIAGLEILSLKLFGSTVLVTKYLYQTSLIGQYILVILITASGNLKYRLLISTFVSAIFLYFTSLIHPGNPQGYDVFMPFFFLMYIYLMIKCRESFIRKNQSSHLIPIIYAIGSGFFLSMTELTRPFIIFILPIIILLSCFFIGRKILFISFIVPVIFISGFWHSHLLLHHNQVTFSNHAGFNLQRAWPDASKISLVDEVKNTPLGIDRWANLNTSEHSTNSKLLQSSVTKYWLQHPAHFISGTIKSMCNLLSGKTNIYSHAPKSSFIWLYKLLVAITSLSIIINIILLIVLSLLNPKKLFIALKNPDSIIIVFTFFSMIFYSISEKGEEARFLISLLPMLSTLPFLFNKKNDISDFINNKKMYYDV